MKIQTNKGIAPIIILLIIAALTGGSTAVYLKTKNKPVSLDSVKENILGSKSAATSLDELEIENTDISISLTSMPKLEVSPLNIAIPQIQTPKFGGVSVPKIDVGSSIKNMDTNIAMPNLMNITPSVSIPSMPKINIPSGINIPDDIPTNVPTTNTAPSGQGSAPSTGAPAIDCGMFASVPSCSYVPAGQAQDACKKCFPGK